MTSSRASRRSPHPVFKAIAAGNRREILRSLLDQEMPLPVQEVAAHLATPAHRSGPEGPTADQHTIHTNLVHADLPVLADAGLVTWDRDADTVETASHPAFADPRFELLLESEADGLDEALSHLANDHRRVLLTILRDAEVSITRRDLARTLLGSEQTELEPDSDAVEDVIELLYHTHLPAMADAGLITYNQKTGRAKYTGHPAVEEIFTIIYHPNQRLADSYDGFFDGLEAAITELWQETETTGGWPHSWRDAHHG